MQFSLTFILACCFLTSATAFGRVVTLPLTPGAATNYVAVASNEVATIIYAQAGNTALDIRVGATLNGHLTEKDLSHSAGLTVAGPVTLSLRCNPPAQLDESWEAAFITVRIEPESFPPGQTLILPAGTVGVVHVQSSTNLIEWRDEWTHTFADTNANRFFRLTAERSTP